MSQIVTNDMQQVPTITNDMQQAQIMRLIHEFSGRAAELKRAAYQLELEIAMITSGMQQATSGMQQAQMMYLIQNLSLRAAEFKGAAYQLDFSCSVLLTQFDKIEGNSMGDELLADISDVHQKIHADQEKNRQVDVWYAEPQTRITKKKRSMSQRSLKHELEKTLDPERRVELIAMIGKKDMERKKRIAEKKLQKQRRHKSNAGTF